MKQYINAFWMCQSMFCSIPCPVSVWDEKARDKMLLFLPVVGLEIGLLWGALGWLIRLLELPALVQGILLCICPFFLTGYIHLDGYMDVLDAVKSCRDLARRREILKDSHVGAFAVIGFVLLVLAQFAFCASVEEGMGCLIFVPVVSRCCSALAVKSLKSMSTSQYHDQKVSKGQLAVLAAMLIGSLFAAFFLAGKLAAALIVGVAGYGFALRKGYRSLEGMNGDISGYALTVCELCCIAALVILQEVL